MPQTNEANAGARGRIEQADMGRLLIPLGDKALRLDAIVQHRLLLDDPQRYGKAAVKKAAVLGEAGIKKLKEAFGKDVKRVGFTVEGIPSTQEVQITRQMWDSLDSHDRSSVLMNTALLVAETDKKPVSSIPDQTPYAMRMLYRRVQFETEKA